MESDDFSQDSKDAGLSQPPSTIMNRFGVRLRELRMERHWSQRRMAVQVGMNRTFLCDLELGKASTSLRMMQVIAEGLELSLSELVQGL